MDRVCSPFCLVSFICFKPQERSFIMIDSHAREIADAQYSRGLSYSMREEGDRQVNLETAIACFQAALQVYNCNEFPMDWAATQNNMGNAYSSLPGKDLEARQANLKRAISCFTSALQIYTLEAFPGDWARTQHNMANAYYNMPDDAEHVSIEKAIAY